MAITLDTSNVNVDLKSTADGERQAPARARPSWASSSANQHAADLGAGTVVLQGGARLKIVQGAVRMMVMRISGIILAI